MKVKTVDMTKGAILPKMIRFAFPVLGVLTTKPLLRILQTSEDLMPQAYAYLVVIFAGSVGTMLYNWISSVFRALGNPLSGIRMENPSDPAVKEKTGSFSA